MPPPKIVWLDEDRPSFPPLEQTLTADSGAPGLLAAGGALSVAHLREAYRRGVFPWFSEGQPILWWSPDPRMVLQVEEFRLSRSLRKTVQRFSTDPGCEIRVDTAFQQVIESCSRTPRPGQDGTWIVSEMVEAYAAWHAQGEVHSFETWIDGELVGGLYGVCLGRMFYGESMFSRRTDASKIALAALVAFCRHHDIGMIDCQQRTGHLASLGGREIPRSQFIRHVEAAIAERAVNDWTFARSLWDALPGLKGTTGSGLARHAEPGPPPGANHPAAHDRSPE